METKEGKVRGARTRHPARGRRVSPLLANLFLHYAFDLWVTRHLRSVRFAATPTMQ